MIPVVCTTHVEPELINEFLMQSYDGYPEAPQSLVLLTSTDWSHYKHDESQLDPSDARKQRSKVLAHGGGPMIVPSRPPWTQPFISPFLNQAPENVARALREAENAPGHLSKDYCIILDQQTTEDRTVLLMKTQRAEGDKLPPGVDDTAVVKVRETFKEANGLITSASVSVSSLSKTLWNQCASKRRE